MEDKILQISASGIDVVEARYKKLVENMVGARVPGYRTADVLSRAFPLYLETAETNAVRGGDKVQIDGMYLNPTPGMLQYTGIATDVAIEGDGFLVVQGDWGDGYTRDGRFILDKEGRMVTVAGNFPVLGKNGPIVVVPGSAIKIDQIGQVIVAGEVVDQLRVVKITDMQNLNTVTGSVFSSGEQEGTAAVIMETPRVIQGYIETSNANIVSLMADLIQLSKIHGIDTKMIQARDQLLSKAVQMGQIQ